jgi:hypothetical protein
MAYRDRPTYHQRARGAATSSQTVDNINAKKMSLRIAAPTTKQTIAQPKNTRVLDRHRGMGGS